MRAIAFAVALLLCGGCKLPNQSASTSSTAIIVDATTSSPPTTPKADGEIHVQAGFGVFVSDQIQSCSDQERTFKTAEGVEKFKKRLADIVAKGPNQKDFTAFPDGCAQTFKDRVALATCTEELGKEGDSAKGTATETIFTVEMLQGDKAMRECMGKKGKWVAIPHDSDAYQMANNEAELRKSQAELKRLQGH